MRLPERVCIFCRAHFFSCSQKTCMYECPLTVTKRDSLNCENNISDVLSNHACNCFETSLCGVEHNEKRAILDCEIKEFL